MVDDHLMLSDFGPYEKKIHKYVFKISPVIFDGKFTVVLSPFLLSSM